MLTVSLLGKFQLTDGSAILNEDNLRSVMLSRLLVYILLYRDRTLTTEDIADAIWQDEEIDSPAGALKNLMYCLRKSLCKSFGDTDFILTNRGAYRWNPKVKVNLDIEQFEQLIKDAKQENVRERAMVKYEQAAAIYQGGLMAKLMDMHWIMTLNTYYHSLFLSCVKALAEIYLKEGRYEELEKLCTDAIKYESGDEQLYCYQIEARMHCGKIGLALESYDKARLIMEKELGIRKTTVLNKVYEELLAVSKGGDSHNIKEIKEDIEEEDPTGVFMCGYPVFKEIYHLEVRKSSRSDSPENLLLLTLESKLDEPEKVAEFRIRQAMEALQETICECLRAGDVVAQYTDSQFIILLPTCTRDLSMLVANRIVAKLYEKNPKYKKIKVKINIEEVSSNGQLVC